MTARDRIINKLIFLLLILMSVFSTILMPVKIGLTGLILIIVFFKVMDQGGIITLNISILKWALLYLGVNTLSILVALFYGIQHALSGITVSIIEPILFFILIAALSEESLKYLFGKFRILTALICIYDIAYFLYINGFLPIGNDSMFPGMYANYGGLSIGFIKIHSNNVPWLMFLFPVIVSEVFITKQRIRIRDCLILFMAIIVAVITLRTAYILVIGLTPFIIFVFARITHIQYNKSRVWILCIAGGIIIVLLLLFSSNLSSMFGGVLEKITVSFNTSVNNIDNGGHTRMEQINDLIETWKEKPLFGWGAAANANHVIRSEIAGNYEMQYFAMLMQRGVIGFGLMVIGMVWIIIQNIRYIKDGSYYSRITFAIIAGFISIIIANATNPYLGSFDRLIIVFFPLMAYKANIMHERSEIFFHDEVLFPWKTIKS